MIHMLEASLNSDKNQLISARLIAQRSTTFSRRHIRIVLGLTFGYAGLLTGCADHNDVATPAATVALVNASGATVGSAELIEDSKGMVMLKVNVKGLPTGIHGIHFHEVGVADPKSSPAFSTSGEHYNPASRKHGLENPNGTHAGDLPNLIVDGQGTGSMETTTNRITLSDGPTTLFDGNGSSLIIHASVDDQKTDPSGNSGSRIAGGVIVRK